MKRGLLLLTLLWLWILPLHAQDDTVLAIHADEPQTVLLTAEAPTVRVYTAESPHYVTITTRSLGEPDAIDTVLRVLDGDGWQIAYADDGDNSNALIENLLLPSAGDYTLLIDSFNSVSAGEVQVTLTISDPFNAVITTHVLTTTITATLPPNGRFVYPVEVTAETLLTITARDTSHTLDPVLWIANADGATLMLNDDHLQPSLTLDVFDAEIVDYRIEADGTLQIVVTDFLGSAGTFELVILRGN